METSGDDGDEQNAIDLAHGYSLNLSDIQL